MTSTETSESHTDTTRLLDETKVLLATAIKGGAARVAAAMQAGANGDGLAFVERIKHDLADAKIEYAARTPDQQRQDARFICDTLQLFRGCPRETCRRMQRCRGNAARCRERFDVPQQVEDYAATRLLGTLMPWVPLRGSDAQRMAFACWVAGMEAAANSARPRESGDPEPREKRTGFQLTRE